MSDTPYYDDMFVDDYTVMSFTECTGLVPTPPLNDAQADSYAEIYHVPTCAAQQSGLRQEEGVHNAKEE